MAGDFVQPLIGRRYRPGEEPLSEHGAVRSAWDELLDRQVALKEVRMPDGVPGLLDRTLREARAVAGIATESAVTVLDVVAEDGRVWLVLRWLDGHTLADRLHSHGPLSVRAVAWLGLELTAALRAHHDVGVVHGPLEPSDVIFTDDGCSLLTAAAVGAVAAAGPLPGSRTSAPPELLAGGPATPAADFWSLGCTLFEAAHGHSPAMGGSLRRPDALLPVLAGLLDPDPANRLDADGAERLLQRALIGDVPKPSPAEPAAVAEPAKPAQPAPTRDWVRAVRAIRWQGLPVRAAAIVAAVALTFAGLSLFDPVPQASSAPASPGTTEPGGATDLARQPTAANRVGTLDGFRLHSDPTGFEVAVPVDWTVRTEDSRTYFQEPAGGRFLLVDQMDEPKDDPVADWETQSVGVSQRLEGYDEIRIEPADYRDYEAADWEFTWARRTTGCTC